MRGQVVQNQVTDFKEWQKGQQTEYFQLRYVLSWAQKVLNN